jgi:putative oxidoreductase
MQKILRLHQAITRFDPVITVWLGSLLSLAIRLSVGLDFFKSGLVKISDWSATLALFHDEYHVPVLPPDLAAYMGAGGELAFPILLALGLVSRPAAVGLFFVNAMAVISYPQLFQFECPAGLKDHFCWGLMALVLVAYGPGRISLDHLLERMRAKQVA